MRRVIVMGPPGSGKSTFARQLCDQLGLPVFHLDQFFWQPGWVQTPEAQFQSEVERISALPAWIIEGNYTTFLEPRLRHADAFVYLDVPAWLSVLRIVRRAWRGKGTIRSDMAPGCPERFDASLIEFVRFTWSWNRLRRERNLGYVRGFQGQQVILASRAEVSAFLRSCADPD